MSSSDNRYNDPKDKQWYDNFDLIDWNDNKPVKNNDDKLTAYLREEHYKELR